MSDRATILLERFIGRPDRVAVLAHWGKPCPVDAFDCMEQLIDGHLLGSAAGPISVFRLDEKHTHEKLRGPFRIGSYVPDSDGNTPWLCIDVDGPPHPNAVADPQAVAIVIQAAFQAAGLPTYIEQSGGGAGWHVWVFFDPFLLAAKARRLALALIPRDILMASGEFADPERSKGIEVFPKQDHVGPDSFGNMVWLPWWYGAKGDANQFHTLNGDGRLHAHGPEAFEAVNESTVGKILMSLGATAPAQTGALPARMEKPQPLRSSGENREWQEWRHQALAALPLESVYSQWLTGKKKNKGWLECRIPWSESGDRHPSGGVADGAGQAERAAFHDFVSNETLSVFDVLVRIDVATDFADARRHVARLSGVPEPTGVPEPDLSSPLSGPGVKEQGVDPHRLARRFLERRCRRDGAATLRFWRHEWWRWNGAHYRNVDTEELRAELTAFVKLEVDAWCARYDPDKPTAKVSKHLVANALQALTGMVIVSGDSEQLTWLDGIEGPDKCLSMANGLINLDDLIHTGRSDVAPHSPQWFSSVHLPYEYDPDASCPEWLGFLDQMLEGDAERIKMLQEWFGYCLLPDTSLQKFLMIEGEGSNGKSVVCKLLGGMLGLENVSHVPLEMFGQRFQLSGTLGKLANIASEVGELDRAAEGILKAFIAGDRMFFDRKGIPGIHAVPTARLVLATNNRPRFADRSSGLWRRMLLLPMSVCIPEDKQNTTLDETLTVELPGILNWAMEGLRRLRSKRRFTNPKVSAEAIDEYRAESNPARLYLLENTQSDRSQSVPCQDLYKRYSDWCEANGYRPLGERMFGKEVVRVYPHVQRPRLGSRDQREYHYQGLSVSSVSTVSHVPYPTIKMKEGSDAC